MRVYQDPFGGRGGKIEPLLNRSGIRRQQSVRLLRHPFLARMVSSACGWWRATTSRTYLESTLSRRRFWKWLFPAVMLSDITGEALMWGLGSSSGSPGVYLQALESCAPFAWLLCALAASRLPVHRLTSDVVLAALFVSYGVYSEDRYSMEVSLCDPFSALLWLLVVLHIGGVHACLIFTSYSAGVLRAFWLCGHWQVLLVLPYGLAPFLVDYSCASFYADWELQRSVIEHLLNKASNGFCSIDRTCGLVSTASSELEETFACQSLVGTSFIDHVEGIGSWEDLLDFCTSEEGELQTTLMTCCTRGSAAGQAKLTFDAKLIPFASSESLISLCIQVVGEKRKALQPEVAEGASPSMDSLAPVGSSLALGVDDSASQGPHAGGEAGHSSALSYSTATMAGEPWSNPPLSAVSWAQTVGEVDSRDIATQTSTRRRCPTPPTPSSSGSASTRLRTSTVRSTNSNASLDSANAERRDACLLGFHRTSRETCTLTLVRSMKHWGVPCPTGACCRWHVTLAEARQVLKELSQQSHGACNHSWTSLLGWQCELCLGLNDFGAARCNLCETAYDLAAGSKAPRLRASRHRESSSSERAGAPGRGSSKISL